MRTIWMGLLCVTLVGGALVGCGDDTEPNTTGTNATGTGTGTGTGGTGGMGGAGGGMGGAGGGMGGAGGGMGGAGGAGGGMMGSLINGCDPDATPLSDKPVTVKAGPGLKYVPACVKVKVGSIVTFDVNFGLHPTAGGTVTGVVPMATPDPNSPIKDTNAGMSADFAFDKAGSYPYSCKTHYGAGMMGAVFVVP
jgi:plastocyanin